MLHKTHGGAVTSIDENLSVKVDFFSSTTYYLAEAAPGTATSAPLWRIAKLTLPSPSLSWADGDDSFDNVWDDHLTLSYS